MPSVTSGAVGESGGKRRAGACASVGDVTCGSGSPGAAVSRLSNGSGSSEPAGDVDGEGASGSCAASGGVAALSGGRSGGAGVVGPGGVPTVDASGGGGADGD